MSCIYIIPNRIESNRIETLARFSSVSTKQHVILPVATMLREGK